MLRKLGVMLLVVCVALGISGGAAVAGEVDLLVQKLVDKGVLTPNEGQILLDETKQDVAKQNAKGVNDAIPLWVQTIKLKGDTRLRFEGIKDKTIASTAAAPAVPTKNLSHERLRVRLGLEAKVNDQTKVGIGLATGKPSDPRSRNISLGNATDAGSDYNPGSAKTIQLDYAFVEYTPIQYATIIGGKFQNPLWQPWDMVWKGDITPEGAALKLNYPVSSRLQLFVNNLGWALRNVDSGDTTKTYGLTQPFMFAIQPGLSWNATDTINLKSAVTFYHINGLYHHQKFLNSNGNNTTGSTGCANGSTSCYQYDYNSVQPSAELGFKQPFGTDFPIQYVGLFGDYIYNAAGSGKRPKHGISGFDYGMKFGYEKVADSGQWQIRLAQSKLGRDAWIDAFSDSDRYGKGQSDTNSYEGILEYGLGKNSSLVLDYYYSTLLFKQPVGGYRPEQVLQLDWVVKF